MKIERGWLRYILGVATMVLAGCQMAPEQAPAVSPALTLAAERHGIAPASLGRGRAMFVTRCVACHALPEMRQLGSSRLQEVVNEMAPRAKLSSGQKEELLVYLRAIQRSS